MPLYHLPRERISPEVMVYGIQTLRVPPHFANFTFTPVGIKPPNPQSLEERVAHVDQCLTRGINPVGEDTYRSIDGVSFVGTRTTFAPIPLARTQTVIEHFKVKASENWDPFKIIVDLPKIASTATAFKRFKDGFMADVMGMGREGYELTLAEICVASSRYVEGKPVFESGVRYKAGHIAPFLKLVIGPNNQQGLGGQNFTKAMQSWFEDLKVNPRLSTTNP